MKEVLKSFSQKSLYDACCDMLNSLQISFKSVTRQALPFNNLYRYELSKSLSEVVDKVEATYYIGNIDEATLSGMGEAKRIEDVEKATSESKYESMMVFAVDITEGKQLSRSQCATLTRGFNRIAAAQPVILFVREGDKLTLSTCERMEYSQEWRRGAGEKLGKVSMLKGIDCLHPHRGHIDILNSLGDKRYPSFDELYKHWMEVFSANVLTEKFYKELFQWFQWAVDSKDILHFPGNLYPKENTIKYEERDTSIIRLITRLMFVWFIKQKGLVPSKIFDKEYLKTILKDFDPYSEKSSNFYSAILQNLFFGTLNRPITEDGELREFRSDSKSADVKNLYRFSELFSISKQDVILLFSEVPFLNCGLFECLDKNPNMDGVSCNYYKDGFTTNHTLLNDGTYKNRAVVPNIFFFDTEKGLFSLFEKYVFTIEENTPQDIQVALDPELLGKVFENLLGAYNPETKETARNLSGSFYTPREIVQYMVNESLIAHLKRTVDDKLEDKFRQLLDFSTQDVELTDEQKYQIVHALFTCKILDPACGSGAFPMGMLQQMVHILRQVDPNNDQWREVLLEMASDDSRRAFGISDEEERNKKLDEIKNTFNNALNSPDYTRKLYIIESCIYGVDIQPIAMLITRLRFFITLICEQNDIMRNKPEENFGIKTLPNLESKFVAANSLISADIHKYNNDWTQDSVLAILKDELMAIRHRHFYTCKRGEKIKLRKDDKKKREQIHQYINKLVGEPNEKRIAELRSIIEEKESELSKYKGELLREESVQTDLFSESKVIMVDVNKIRRDEINGIIVNCRKDIERELNKSVPKGFEAAVLQVTDWNPYDQNTVSPFLDIEWMFGVSDGFDIVIGNPPYIQLQNNSGVLAKLYEDCGYSTFARTGDIYCLFYERAHQLLQEHGHLCFITSNKWMRAGYGEKTRSFFAKYTNPLLLIDFAGVKIFESATVDTNILLYSKSENEHKTICAVTDKQNKDSVNNLSVFVKQQHTVCDFSSSDSWVILSPIEQSIKRKIEAVGTPLKDWDIQINYGIKTGYNEAFIITTEKRDEILSNCKSEDERQKTAELIRPILRGRDIKRYGYDWANLYLIATFPACHYNIEDYPAVKNYLLSFAEQNLRDSGNNWIADSYLEDYCKQKLAQTGKFIEITGKRVYIGNTAEKARKRTSNKWFETQDSISYWDLFFQPHICWKAVGRNLAFAIVESGIFLTAPASFISAGIYNETIIHYLCSTVGKYFIYKNSDTTGAGDIMLNIQSLIQFPIPMKKFDSEGMSINEIDNAIYKVYGFTNEEITYIKSQI